jgi:hypothetical protein
LNTATTQVAQMQSTIRAGSVRNSSAIGLGAASFAAARHHLSTVLFDKRLAEFNLLKEEC